jgi:hypothetical protein
MIVDLEVPKGDSDLHEYIVTLHRADDLDSLYDDMETPGGNLHIPGRAVDVAVRREISRNTHYMLTHAEAMALRSDPRVLAVELTPKEYGLIVRPTYTQTSTEWNRSTGTNTAHRNYGLLRCFEGVQRAGWGSDGTVGNRSQTGTITINNEGRNVDVVIVDGMINPAHPEMAKNPDGTGGTKVIQYNWFVHNVGDGKFGGNYTYTPYTGGVGEDDNNHGVHVAGTVVGNTQGWARSANVYNINPYGTDPNGVGTLFLIDYIRQFHANKPVNPATGRKNPTICNHSWGFAYQVDITTIGSIVYRGVNTPGPFTAVQLGTYGVMTFVSGPTTFAIVPARYPAFETDLADAIADGIIQVGAAANDSTKIDVPGGLDYNNYFIFNEGGTNYGAFYHQGSAPAAAPNIVCVGAGSSVIAETKASFSNCGPRVDIHAPGQHIISSVHSGGVADPRNGSFQLVKYSGTSMASPQVCGLLACALETYPGMTQAQAREYLFAIAKTGQMTDTGGSYTDFTSLQGAPNRHLTWREERASVGGVFPKKNTWIRPTTGIVYPRRRAR